MRYTPEEMKKRIEALPPHVMADIIYGVAWDLFGDIDDDADEATYVETDRKPTGDDLTEMVGWFHEELTNERREPKVKEVICRGELEIEPGHTFDEIIQQSNECLDGSSTWDICGEVLFQCDDDKYYVGTIEFIIAPANPDYVKDVLERNNEGEND